MVAGALRRMNFTGLFFAVLLSTSVVAQDFPAKPVRVVVPFPPGGGADALARLLGPKLPTCGDSR